MNRFLNGLKNVSYRLRRRCFVVDGHTYYARVSEECWYALNDICTCEGISLQQLVEQVVRNSTRHNLSAELDLFALAYFQAACQPNSLHKLEPANLLPC